MTGPTISPLRAVVRHGLTRMPDDPVAIERDVLECGHVLPVAKDAFGPRYPARRRCWKCRRGLPAEAWVKSLPCSAEFEIALQDAP
jgi:hypothetical protein